jgi:cobalt-zinc-cadmium efflux system membrane fusion protein
MSKLWVYLITGLCAACVLAGCQGGAPAQPQSQRAQTIETAAVSFQTISPELMIPASVQPDPERVVHVFAPVSGRLISLKVRVGDRVRAAQPVAVLQSSDAAQARSDFEKARAQAERSQSALRRASLLYDHHAIAAKDLEDAKAQSSSDQSELDRSRERLQMLGLSEGQASDQVNVMAPRSGVVIETTSAPGEFAKSLDASNPLLTIADLSSVWVVGNIYERDLETVPPGAPVRITAEAYPSQSWQGRISKISDVVDPATRTVKVRVVLNNGERKLKPDMFAAIHVTRPPVRVAVVPSSAVLRQGNESFVILKTGQEKFEKRVVAVEQTGPSETRIRSGLQQGDTVVTSGAELLREEAAK